MFKYEIIVVLYNTSIDNSETLQSLLKAKGAISDNNHIIVWDNSPMSVINNDLVALEERYHPCEVSYYWDGINHPLSFIYNKVRKELNSRFAIILDHDTSLPEEFFEFLDKITEDEKNLGINLYLPTLYSNDQIVSPAYEYRYTHKPLGKGISGCVKSDYLQAMNSGMIINSAYYRDVFPGYNEKLKFYGTDNDFMRKYRAQNAKAFILPIRINHKSNFREDPLPQRVERFAAIREAALLLAKEEGVIMVLFEYLRYFYLSIIYDIKAKTILFTRRLVKKES